MSDASALLMDNLGHNRLSTLENKLKDTGNKLFAWKENENVRSSC